MGGLIELSSGRSLKSKRIAPTGAWAVKRSSNKKRVAPPGQLICTVRVVPPAEEVSRV